MLQAETFRVQMLPKVTRFMLQAETFRVQLLPKVTRRLSLFDLPFSLFVRLSQIFACGRKHSTLLKKPVTDT